MFSCFLTIILQPILYNTKVSWSTIQQKRSNIMLKYQKTCQIILLILGVSMVSYGAVRGEAATVLGKAIKLCLECVGIG